MNFDAAKEVDRLVKEIKEWFDQNCKNGIAVLGISGGKDSTVTAALLARALGRERVMGVLMPCGEQRDLEDSFRVVTALQIPHVMINIQNAFHGMINTVKSTSEDARVNLQPRLRMAALYMVAQSTENGGIVINTCNRSEDYVGYATKFGDCAGDVSILGNYLVSEILAMGDAMPEIPNDLVHKAPADGLWGDTDEDRFGFTYAELESFIKTGTSGNTLVDKKIEKMHRSSRHKYNPMPMLGSET